MAARDSQDLPRRIADLEGEDAYAVLGVRPDAAKDEIVSAYRREMARTHPDRGGSAPRAQLVNCAFDVLTRHREDYDDLLDAARAAGADGAGSPLDVLHVVPDADPLVDPLVPGRRRWGSPKIYALATLAVFVAVAAVIVDRADPEPPPVPAWTTSEASAAASPPSAEASSPSNLPDPSSAGNPADPSGGGSVSTWSVPATVVVVAASAPPSGGGHRCEVRGDGSLWCSGGNAHGQVGDGTTTDAASPVRVAGPAGARWAAVAVGGGASCALTEAGALWCWGDNGVGQVGDGTSSSRTSPVAVGGVDRWLALAVDRHVCAVRTDRTLWCWGAAGQGQLGDGVQVDQASPRQVGAEAGWAGVSVGPGWTCGTRLVGGRRCWGTGWRVD